MLEQIYKQNVGERNNHKTLSITGKYSYQNRTKFQSRDKTLMLHIDNYSNMTLLLTFIPVTNTVSVIHNLDGGIHKCLLPVTLVLLYI